MDEITKLKNQLRSEFERKDLSSSKIILSIQKFNELVHQRTKSDL